MLVIKIFNQEERDKSIKSKLYYNFYNIKFKLEI